MWGYLVALAATSAVTVAIGALEHFAHIPNISLLYLPPILLTAVSFGTGPSLAAATLAVLQYDFFLLQPIHTFSIGHAEDILAFIIFLIVAVLTSQLAAQARERVEAAQRRARESTTLYELGQALMSTRDVDQILDAITQRIVDVFRVDRCAIFVPGMSGRLDLAAETLRGGRRDRASHATAAYAFQQGTEMGLPDGSGLPDNRRVYVPLRTADHVVGVMEVGRKRSGDALDLEERRLLTSFAAQAALVISRAQSDEERHRLQVVEESDRLKSALLNAVSHDLRTPLASIKASATALLLADASWSTGEGREFLEAIDHEADRLNRLVGNLLDLSRIEAGVLRPVLDWYDVREVIDTILPRLRPLLGQRPFLVDIGPDIPPIRVDLLRLEELLVNLVENAVKYTPQGSPIELRVWLEDGLKLAVVDHGPGIPPAQRESVFETFSQGQQAGDRQPGTGLGLAICRGVAHAHGGTITVAETPGGGASFMLHLPPSLLGDRVSA
ncbi:MAG TPA: ATP-binding protein [Chloroflexota bacterium]